MTRNFSPLYPDCLAGALCAFEGLRGAMALLNGPTGCKYYNSYLVDRQDPAGFSFDPIPFGEKFYFGQPRVPASAVEGEDYVYGTGPKVRDLLQHIKKNCRPRLLGIINSPGPTLIGDDLLREVEAVGIQHPVVFIESPGFTNSWADGYQSAMIEILKQIPYQKISQPGRKTLPARSPRAANRKKQKAGPQVNLVGFMIGQHNWQDDLEEIERMLRLLGLRVNVNIGAGELLENLFHLPAADYNLVVAEEYGAQIAFYVEERFGLPTLVQGVLPPYGLEATEIWGRTIAEELGLDASAFNREAEEVRRKCYSAISRIASVRGLPRGVNFAIFGDGYQIAPLLLFFYRYLGMYPVIIGVRECGSTHRRFLQEFLSREGLDGVEVLESPNQAQIARALRSNRPEIVLGSNFEEHILTAELSDCSFIGTSFPLWNRFQLTHRPLLGLNGVLVLVEEILHVLSTKVDLPE